MGGLYSMLTLEQFVAQLPTVLGKQRMSVLSLLLLYYHVM